MGAAGGGPQRRCTARARSASSRRSATTIPDQSHFTSRHFWEVGATDVQGRFGWMGRFLDLHGDADNPLQGLSLDWTLSPALAAADVPVAAVARPDDFGLWAPGVGDPIETPMFEAIGTLGRLPTTDPQRRVARLVATEVDDIRRTLGPFQAQDGQPGFTSPVAYPDNDFAASARRARRDARRRRADPLRRHRRARRLRHALQPGRARSATTSRPSATRCSRSSATSRRAASPTASSRRSGRSSAGARSRTTRGTDHGAGGVAFVIGTKAKGQQIGEFPGLATLDDGDNLVRHGGLPCGLLLAAGAVVRRRRGADHPGRVELRAPRARGVSPRYGRPCLSVELHGMSRCRLVANVS